MAIEDWLTTRDGIWRAQSQTNTYCSLSSRLASLKRAAIHLDASG